MRIGSRPRVEEHCLRPAILIATKPIVDLFSGSKPGYVRRPKDTRVPETGSLSDTPAHILPGVRFRAGRDVCVVFAGRATVLHGLVGCVRPGVPHHLFVFVFVFCVCVCVFLLVLVFCACVLCLCLCCENERVPLCHTACMCLLCA